MGQPDRRFTDMAVVRNGKFYSPQKELVAFLDSGRCIYLNGSTYISTVRHCNCELLVTDQSVRCNPCQKYRDNLRAVYSNFTKEKSTAATGTNLRYMQSREKDRRIKALKSALRNKQKRLMRIQGKLKKITEQSGIMIDGKLQNDFKEVIDGHQSSINKLPTDDFKRIFWEQQVIMNSCMHVVMYSYMPT